MDRTTIEVSEGVQSRLREERMPHESNYSETIERLLGEDQSPYVTESEVRGIVSDMVLGRALR